MSHFFETSHPENGFDVVVCFDEDNRLVSASYSDDADVPLTPTVKEALQTEIDAYCKPD